MPLLDRSDASDLGVIIVGGVLLTVSGVGFVRSVPWRRVYEKIRSRMQRSPSSDETKDEEVERIVRAKMKATRLSLMMKGSAGLNLILAAFTCMLIINILKDTGTRKSFVVDIAQLLCHFVAATVTACPRLLTWRTKDVIYAAFLIIFTIVLSPLACEPDKLLYRTLVTDLMVFFMNVMRGSLHIVLPLNLPFVVVSCVTILQCGQELPIPAMYMIFMQLMFLSIFPACARQLDHSMESAIRQTLEVDGIKELLSAATALLRTCCDVVVECDVDGVILCPALDLGSFLLRRQGSRNLQNTCLASLISEEADRRVFLGKLGEPRPSGVGLADVVHAQMRDGSNVLLKVELLTFEFRHVGGQQRYMIGIRHFSDIPLARRSAEPKQHPQEGSVSDGDDEDMSSRSASSDVYQDDTTDLTAPTVIVDSTKEALPIRGWSPSFQMRVGRLPPGSGLRELVQNGDDFADWMHMAAQYGSDWPNSRLTLNLRQGRVRASCRVAGNAADEFVDRERVELVFLNITHDRCPSDGSRSRGSRPHRNYRGTPVLRMPL